jgi:putative flippase GtrA
MSISVVFDRKLTKFIIVGVINTLIGSLIMFLLYNAAHINYWVSSSCNYFFTSILSFLLNKYYTFTVREWSVFMVFSFVIVIAISYIIAYGVAKPVVNYFLYNNSQKFRENIALFTGMCIFTGLNYLGQRFIVFKNN